MDIERAISCVVANAEIAPDPRMEGATDCYLVPLEDIDALRNATPADSAERQALLAELDEAELKAIDALARYKFAMFGYWAGIWVHLNRISHARRRNPFGHIVAAARTEKARNG